MKSQSEIIAYIDGAAAHKGPLVLEKERDKVDKKVEGYLKELKY